MVLQPEKIDELNEQMAAYERIHFGIKNGEDFSLLATAFSKSKSFDAFNKIATLMGALLPITMERGPDGKPKENAMEKAFAESPLRGILADVFYLGYKLGRAQAETASLEELAQK